MSELLLGCGKNRERRLAVPGRAEGEWKDLVTLDMDPVHRPDLLWDISTLPLPFKDDQFDTVNAYDVLEHVGRQGSYNFFFDQWSDIWRILKPNGLFTGVSPGRTSPWLWGDPGHVRLAMSHELLIFLSQPSYDQVGTSAMTDYRFCYKADFNVLHAQLHEDGQFSWVLEAVKPSRIKT